MLRESVQSTEHFESFPAVAASKSANSEEYCDMHGFKCLKAPHHDRKDLTVLGCSAVAKGVILWEDAVMDPEDQIQPRMVVLIGHTTVFVADSLRLLVSNFCSIFSQLLKSLYFLLCIGRLLFS